jgi:hypothetical protein
MSKARWIMKQYWRISAIRAWMGLALGMFSLGKVYAAQTPGLAELGLIGALILGSVLVLVFLGVGWLYDVKGKMWSPSVSFFEKHPFLDETRPKKRVSFTAKSKLEFEVIQLRLDWIQQLTGMLQDSLIFAAVYVVLIFPGVAVDNVVPIPFLILGFLLLSIPMLFIITLSGWYYDKKLRIWSPDMIVKVERTPYTYVAYPRLYVMDLPAYYALLDTMKMIMEKQGIEPFEIERIIEYMNTYCDFKSSREQDMEKARALRREYGEVFVTKEVE